MKYQGRRFLQTAILICALALESFQGFAQSRSSVPPAPQLPIKERDGQHDFDFNIGTWKTKISRLQHPLTGSATWVKWNGTVVVRKVWDGRANLEEIKIDGPTGHIEGLTLRLYNPQSHQWTLSWSNSSDGTLDQPLTGEFKNGRGVFFQQEQYNGRTIMVRQTYSNITPDSHSFEQAFSVDGGTTWEPNWIATLTREKQ
jgi:hypothetical protein